MRNYAGHLVFGLDIGTRSIVGTVGYKNEDRFIVVAQKVKEHETRAMLDGQIHDIEKVGNSIKQVKEYLEEQIGRKLTDVCIAAAGRVLETSNSHAEVEFEEEHTITKEDVYALNSLAIEKAYASFMERNTTAQKFYCVGNSVVNYYLNDFQISNLENHKARKIAVELIATFLPDEVVDGLNKAVELAGLHVANMTLEPIAAIQVAIPERFRLLNIALVDVGAGTSDISITKDGSIIAYGMIPIAGDSLTEAIAMQCLTDFYVADQMKQDSTVGEIVTYEDIMGLKQTIATKELDAIMEPILEDMTTRVSDKIKELNGGKSVSAVFVVGGGGKVNGYTQRLSDKLGIQAERVALRGKEVMQKIEFMDSSIEKDSLLVTPIGICLNFYEQNNNFIFVSFNGQKIKLYDNKHLKVTDAAIQANFPNDGFFPKRGKELNFTVDGIKKIVR
ncbi:MAG: cell division protein FtsA, partial [Lachnospiraceae bacterium]|nr:cell division protein FtsA [Lachnospiraceae bacterium]